MNAFTNVAEYPPGNLRLVVRVNFDTLYSLAWLDMTKEPMVVSVPDTNGRYYLLQMLGYVDRRVCLTGLAHHWHAGGQLPRHTSRLERDHSIQGMTRVNASTPYVWIIGRTKTDGPPDYDAVHKIQAGYKITPLSQWGKSPAAGGSEN